MKKENLPLIILIVSIALFFGNIIFASDEINLGFWMRLLSNALIIIAMSIKIYEKRKLN